MAYSTPPPKTRLSQQSTSSQSSDADQIYDPMHIYDPIHGYMTIPDRIKAIIDTRHFQRLRGLKQLGTSYFVFPGGSHNRFEHSMGVMYLAYKLLKKIKDRQPELQITEDELFCVSAAGLLHDLGHGPFSHVFDNEFVPSIKFHKFRHEDMSVKLIFDLFKSNDIDIDAEHLELIQALVSPSTHEQVYAKYREKKRGFLFEIVANELTGIDVDKWDYFLRDSSSIGIGISFKYDRLMEHVRVINDHICWSEKTSFELYEMFRTRYELFKKIYSHKASKAIEYMICDILKYANDVFKITDKLEQCEHYLDLDDSIIGAIQMYPIHEGMKGMENLKKAKALIQRLHRRQLYKCCGYLLLSPRDLVRFNPAKTVEIESNVNNNKNNNDNKSKDGEQDMNECHEKIAYKEIEREWASQLYDMYERYLSQEDDQENPDEREPLIASDIVVQLMSLSFGMETQHPMEKAFLYKSNNVKECHQVGVDQITTMSGPFREIVVRAYVKRAEWKQECSAIFTQFAKRKGLVIDDDSINIHASLVISPSRPKKTRTRVVENNTDKPLTSTTSDNKTSGNNNNRKRARSNNTDLLDTVGRNKRRKIVHQ